MDEDLKVVQQWWSRLAPTVPESIAALWFGITDLVTEGRPRRTLYVAGCESFDPLDGEWAVPPYAWWPTDRYTSPAGLADLPDRDHRAVLNYAATLIRTVAPHRGLELDGVAVGFDDGDLIVVWVRI